MFLRASSRSKGKLKIALSARAKAASGLRGLSGKFARKLMRRSRASVALFEERNKPRSRMRNERASGLSRLRVISSISFERVEVSRVIPAFKAASDPRSSRWISRAISSASRKSWLALVCSSMANAAFAARALA